MSSLRARQVHEKQLTSALDSLFLDLDLGDGVTSTGGLVGSSSVSRSDRVALLDEL